MKIRALSPPILSLLRVHHWTKNVSMLPGVALAIRDMPLPPWPLALGRFLAGVVALCSIASSNYVINGMFDAEYDAQHPTKRLRPMASRALTQKTALNLWAVLLTLGLGLSCVVSAAFAGVMLAFVAAGLLYNTPGVRTKNWPYLDVLSESLNNPLRLLAGWYIFGTVGHLSGTCLFCYWMLGAFFMSLKRFAELRSFGDQTRAAAYRPSFAHYTELRLMLSALLAGSLSLVSFCVFALQYKIELVLALPAIGLFMGTYVRSALKPDGAAQAPEKLHKDPWLVLVAIVCSLSLLATLSLDAHWLRGWTQSAFGAAAQKSKLR